MSPTDPRSVTRYLTYQPVHGLGVDALVCATAMDLAQRSGRVLLLPPVPHFESRTNARDLSHYFSIPYPPATWCAFPRVEEGRVAVDRLLRIVPRFKRNFRDTTVRAMHPVWSSKIEDPAPHLRAAGFDVGRIETLELNQRISRADLVGYLCDEDRIVHLSYLHDVLAESPAGDNLASYLAQNLPCVPHARITDEVGAATGLIHQAIHARRGNLRAVVALTGHELPVLDSYLRGIGDADRFYIASDEPVPNDLPVRGVRIPAMLPLDDQIESAVRDLAACLIAKRFVGTERSTFSFLIAAARLASGRDPESTSMV